MRKFATVLVLLLLCSGCITTPKGDPETVKSLKQLRVVYNEDAPRETPQHEIDAADAMFEAAIAAEEAKIND